MYLSIFSISPTSARSGLSIACTAAAGRPHSCSACWITFTVAALVRRSLSRRAGSPRCRFSGTGGDVDRHVRTRFINHANHPQRDAATFNTQTAVQQPAVDHRPTGSARLHTGAHRWRCRSDAPGSARGDRASLHSGHWRELRLNLPRWRAEYRRSALPDNRRSFPVPDSFPGWRVTPAAGGRFGGNAHLFQHFQLLNG